MNCFIKKMLIYLLPIALVAIGMELYVESIPNSYIYKRSYMDRHIADIKTLVLGSSYAYDGIDAKVLEHTFNLANSSQCFEDDYRLLQRYIMQMDSLERVILPMSYSSLQMVSSSNRRCYYTIYMNLYPRWPLSKYSMECFNLELMLKKMAKYLLNEDVVRCDSLGQRLGHTLSDRPLNWKNTEELIANDSFVGQSAMAYVEENRLWLEQIAELCDKRCVTLWLVAMPVMSDYRMGMPQEQIAQMERIMQEITMRYDCVQVCDYQEWGSEEDFWNATHINTHGALRLTRELVNHNNRE